MSLIAYYARGERDLLEMIAGRAERIFEEAALPNGAEVIDVDRAHDALAWLVSPLKRAETVHMSRLIADPDWAEEEAASSAKCLAAMPIDDALAALEGRTSQRVESVNLGMGEAAFFDSGRVRTLSSALAAISEQELRTKLDFAAMDAANLSPGDWRRDGEKIFEAYLRPALRRLQSFYAAATSAEQIVLVLWT